MDSQFREVGEVSPDDFLQFTQLPIVLAFKLHEAGQALEAKQVLASAKHFAEQRGNAELLEEIERLFEGLGRG